MGGFPVWNTLHPYVFLCGRSGVVPAVLGQFVSHGTRTAAFEGTLMALAALGAGSGSASAVQWQVQCLGLGLLDSNGHCFALQ